MNYTTALELPRWTAEIQGYSQTVIRYTPIIFKAFSKTITPQLLATFKDLSHYYIQCGRNCGAWAMNAAGITHNPIQSAVRSAYAELTSADAQATYRRISHITRETAMDALVVALCGVVAVATTIEAAQALYRHAAALYGKVYARFNPAPAPVDLALCTSDEEIAALVENIQAERHFFAQFDQLDADVLAIIQAEVDEALAQVTIDELKSARASLVLAQEGDRLAQEALAYVVDQAVKLAASLQVPGATGKPKPKRKPRASAKTTEAKPKQTRAGVKAK